MVTNHNIFVGIDVVDLTWPQKIIYGPFDPCVFICISVCLSVCLSVWLSYSPSSAFVCIYLVYLTDSYSLTHLSASTLVYSSPIQSTLGGSIRILIGLFVGTSIPPPILYPSTSITAQHMLVCMDYVNLSVPHANTGIIRNATHLLWSRQINWFSSTIRPKLISVQRLYALLLFLPHHFCRTAKYCQTLASIWSGCKSSFESSSA